MARFIGKRVGLGVLVVIGVVALTFVIARVVPGDPAVTYAGPHATPASIAQARRQLGLDKPVVVQLIDYLEGIAKGDWGTSYRTRQPVLSNLGTALPASIELVVAGMVIALLIGLPLGLLSARFRGRAPDVLVRVVAVIGVSVPVFWLALILQRVFAGQLHWLPAAGEYSSGLYYTSPLTSYTNMPVLDALVTGNWAVLGSALSHLLLPALVVAAYPAGLIARMTRTASRCGRAACSPTGSSASPTIRIRWSRSASRRPPSVGEASPPPGCSRSSATTSRSPAWNGSSSRRSACSRSSSRSTASPCRPRSDSPPAWSRSRSSPTASRSGSRRRSPSGNPGAPCES